MKRLRFLILLLLVSSPSFAEERAYHFRPTLEGSGLRFVDSGGTRWKWLMLACPTSFSDCEIQINQKGGRAWHEGDCTPHERLGELDLGFVVLSEARLRVTCFQPSCVLQVRQEESSSPEQTLSTREHADVPMNAVLHVRFE